MRVVGGSFWILGSQVWKRAQGFGTRVDDLGSLGLLVRWTPHPVIVTIRDNKD